MNCFVFFIIFSEFGIHKTILHITCEISQVTSEWNIKKKKMMNTKFYINFFLLNETKFYKNFNCNFMGSSFTLWISFWRMTVNGMRFFYFILFLIQYRKGEKGRNETTRINGLGLEPPLSPAEWTSSPSKTLLLNLRNWKLYGTILPTRDNTFQKLSKKEKH